MKRNLTDSELELVLNELNKQPDWPHWHTYWGDFKLLCEDGVERTLNEEDWKQLNKLRQQMKKPKPMTFDPTDYFRSDPDNTTCPEDWSGIKRSSSEMSLADMKGEPLTREALEEAYKLVNSDEWWRQAKPQCIPIPYRESAKNEEPDHVRISKLEQRVNQFIKNDTKNWKACFLLFGSIILAVMLAFLIDALR